VRDDNLLTEEPRTGWGQDRREDVRYALLALSIPLILYAATLNGRVATDYTSSILGTQFALWRDHSFSLGPPGDLITETIDKGLYEGEYYSAISPGLAVLTYPFGALGFSLDGGEFNPFGNALLLDEAAIALAGALGILFTYRICRFYAPPRPSFLASLCLAFGTTVWPFATVMFPHVVAMSLSIVAVYLVLRYCRDQSGWTSLVLAGWCLGLATFTEYVALLLIIPLTAYLILSLTDRRWRVWLFAAGVVIGPLLHLFFNFVAFRNPLVFPEGLKAHETVGRFDIAAMPGHILAYVISPYRGVLLLSPVLAFGVVGLVRMLRDDTTRLDATLFIALFLMVVIPYSAWFDWAGGVGYGPRFLILGLPYVAVPISVALTRLRSRLVMLLFVMAFLASSLIQAAGALAGPFSAGDIWTYEPARRITAAFGETTTAWWILRAPGPDSAVSHVFAAAVVASLWTIAIVTVRAIWRTERLTR
jgi:hypothetical protein